MEGPDAIIKVQSLVFEAMELMTVGDYHSALQKFEEAKSKCQKLKPLYLGENLATLKNIEERCSAQSTQIEQYIESSDDINLSESQLLSDSSVFRESDLGNTSMLLPQFNNRDGETEELGDKYWGGYLWDKVEALLGLLHPHTEQFFQKYQVEPNPNHREEITLESSFILMPNENNSQRVFLNEPVKHVTIDPNERIKELESKLALIQHQLEQSKKIVQPKGVANLMNENTKLKRSIIEFSNHVQKHNSLRRTQSAYGDQSVFIGNPTTPKDTETQIRDLILKVAILEKENLRKDKEIQELKVYHEKWQNLKKEASARRQQRTSISSGTDTIQQSNLDFVESQGIDESKVYWGSSVITNK